MKVQWTTAIISLIVLLVTQSVAGQCKGAHSDAVVLSALQGDSIKIAEYDLNMMRRILAYLQTYKTEASDKIHQTYLDTCRTEKEELENLLSTSYGFQQPTILDSYRLAIMNLFRILNGYPSLKIKRQVQERPLKLYYDVRGQVEQAMDGQNITINAAHIIPIRNVAVNRAVVSLGLLTRLQADYKTACAHNISLVECKNAILLFKQEINRLKSIISRLSYLMNEAKLFVRASVLNVTKIPNITEYSRHEKNSEEANMRRFQYTFPGGKATVVDEKYWVQHFVERRVKSHCTFNLIQNQPCTQIVFAKQDLIASGSVYDFTLTLCLSRLSRAGTNYLASVISAVETFLSREVQSFVSVFEAIVNELNVQYNQFEQSV